MELNIGIIAACLPTLRPLFSWLFVTAKTINASVHFPTTRRRYVRTVDEENIKLSQVPSHADTISSSGKDGYHISVIGGHGNGPLDSHKTSRRLSLNLGREHSRPKTKLERSIVEQEQREQDRDTRVGVAVGDRGPGQTESQWGTGAIGGIMRTTEVFVSR